MLTVNSKSVHQAGCLPACPSTADPKPPSVSHSHPCLPGGCPKPAGWSGPGSHQIAAFPLGPCVLKTLYVPLGVKSLFPPVRLRAFDCMPCLFSKARRSGNLGPVPDSRLRSLIWGSELSCARTSGLVISQFVLSPTWG